MGNLKMNRIKMKRCIKVAFLLFAVNRLIYSKNIRKSVSIESAKIGSFLTKNRHFYERVSLDFLIKPASFSSDSNLDFKKVFLIPKN